MKRTILVMVVTLVSLACHRPTTPPADAASRMLAAETLTEIFAHSRLDRWNIQAFAISERCSVLLVHVDGVLGDDGAEAFYYGAKGGDTHPRYEVTPGGVRQFAIKHGFRGAIFEDVVQHRMAFANAKVEEAEKPAICGMPTR